MCAPMDRSSIRSSWLGKRYRMGDCLYLSVNLAGIELENPILLASGTAGYGFELSRAIDLSLVGGVVLKSVTPLPRRGNPEPRIWETTGGVLNSIGLENVGIDKLVAEVLPRVEELGTKIFVSIAGDTVRDYGRLAARLEDFPLVSAIELNISCPNVEGGGIEFGKDPKVVKAVVEAARENSSKPLFPKLSATVNDIAEVASSAAEAGASGLSLINTLPGMAIDARGRKPRLGAVTGGLSGPAIKPIALKAVWECHRATALPIIGGGGIYNAFDVVEFMLAGATACALGTVALSNPRAALEIIESLPPVISSCGGRAASELIGALKVEGDE